MDNYSKLKTILEAHLDHLSRLSAPTDYPDDLVSLSDAMCRITETLINLDNNEDVPY